MSALREDGDMRALCSEIRVIISWLRGYEGHCASVKNEMGQCCTWRYKRGMVVFHFGTGEAWKREKSTLNSADHRGTYRK